MRKVQIIRQQEENSQQQDELNYSNKELEILKNHLKKLAYLFNCVTNLKSFHAISLIFEKIQETVGHYPLLFSVYEYFRKIYGELLNRKILLQEIEITEKYRLFCNYILAYFIEDYAQAKIYIDDLIKLYNKEDKDFSSPELLTAYNRLYKIPYLFDCLKSLDKGNTQIGYFILLNFTRADIYYLSNLTQRKLDNSYSLKNERIAYYLYGISCAYNGHYDKAFLFHQYVNQSEGILDRENNYRLGICYAIKGEWLEAEQCFLRVDEATKDKNDLLKIKALYWLARLTYKMGRYDEALDHLSHLSRYHEYTRPYNFPLTEVTTERGSTLRGIDPVGLQIQEQDFENFLFKSKIYYHKKAVTLCLKNYKNALSIRGIHDTKWICLAPKVAGRCYGLSRLLLEKNNFKGALDCYKTIVAVYQQVIKGLSWPPVYDANYIIKYSLHLFECYIDLFIHLNKKNIDLESYQLELDQLLTTMQNVSKKSNILINFEKLANIAHQAIKGEELSNIVRDDYEATLERLEEYTKYLKDKHSNFQSTALEDHNRKIGLQGFRIPYEEIYELDTAYFKQLNEKHHLFLSYLTNNLQQLSVLNCLIKKQSDKKNRAKFSVIAEQFKFDWERYYKELLENNESDSLRDYKENSLYVIRYEFCVLKMLNIQAYLDNPIITINPFKRKKLVSEVSELAKESKGLKDKIGSELINNIAAKFTSRLNNHNYDITDIIISLCEIQAEFEQATTFINLKQAQVGEKVIINNNYYLDKKNDRQSTILAKSNFNTDSSSPKGALSFKSKNPNQQKLNDALNHTGVNLGQATVPNKDSSKINKISKGNGELKSSSYTQEPIMPKLDSYEQNLDVLQDLLAKNDPQHKAAEFFRLMAENRITWEILIKALVVNSGDNEQAQKNMQVLVAYRDVIDRDIFRKAIEAMFPNQHYAYQYDAQSKPDNYVIKIYNVNNQIKGGWLTHTSEQEPNCILTIKAPGSRTLTSDIDTTVSATSGTKQLSIVNSKLDVSHLQLLDMNTGELAVASKHDLTNSVDYFTRIQATLIDQFYRISEDIYTISSGEHRDSNVYSSGFLEEGLYPVFAHKQPERYKNPQLNFQLPTKDWFFDKMENYISFYEPQRSQKHQLELAASLVSLYQALTQPGKFCYASSWSDFKNLILEKFKNNPLALEDWNGKNNSTEGIFSITETLCQYYEDTLKEARQYAPDKQDATLINEIYARHILRVAECNEALIELQTKVEEKKKVYNNLVRELTPHQLSLLQASDDDVEGKQFYQNKVGELENALKERKAVLIGLLEQQAGLLINRQQWQIKANLFANEAYVNRAAPYHVVNGLQMKQAIDWSKHVVLGSTLQQLGFFLLHSKLQFEKDYTPGEVFYKNAKYLMRIAHILFGKDMKWHHQKKKKVLEKVNLLPHIVGNWNRRFEDYYDLFNNALYIIEKIKGDPSIPDGQKYEVTYAEMSERMGCDTPHAMQDCFKNQELRQLLAFTGQLIKVVYKAKREEKGNQLWGSFFASQQPLIARQPITTSPIIQANSQPRKLEASTRNTRAQNINIRARGTNAVSDGAHVDETLKHDVSAKHLQTDAKSSFENGRAKNVKINAKNAGASVDNSTIQENVHIDIEHEEETFQANFLAPR
jgi:hypothetical protein